MPDPNPHAARELQDRLEAQSAFTTTAAPVALVIARVPSDRGSKGYATFAARPGAALPRAGSLRLPGDALKEPGTYLAIEDRHENLVHAVRVGGPPVLVAETETGGVILSDIRPAGETMRSVIQPAGPDVISATLPFAPHGYLEVFEVDKSGNVATVLLRVELESDPDRMPRVRLHRREP